MRLDRAVRTALLVVGAVVLTGCALTREPVRLPDEPLPDAFPAVSDTIVDLPDPWWSLFGDTTLDALVHEALAHNPDAAIAAARVAEARALAGIADADRWPSVGAQASAERAHASELTLPSVPGADTTFDQYDVRAVVGYEVDFWGRYAHASAAARDRLAAAEFDRDALRLSLTGEAVRAYFALAAAIVQHAQARETLANREESLRIERLRFEGGESEEVTFRRVEAEVEGARAAMHDFELAVEQRQNVLGLLLGRSPRELVQQRVLPQASAPWVTGTVPRLPAGLPSTLLGRRPDVRAAEARLMAAAGDVGVARAAMFPSLSLTAAYGSASLELGDLFTTPAELWSVGATLFQPIFQGGRLRANLERTRAVQLQVQSDYARTVQGAFRDVLDGLQGQTSLSAVAEARRAQVQALRRATELAELRYSEGDIAYLELLDVRRGLFAAEIDFVEARRAALANTVDLALALGGGPTIP